MDKPRSSRGWKGCLFAGCLSISLGTVVGGGPSSAATPSSAIVTPSWVISPLASKSPLEGNGTSSSSTPAGLPETGKSQSAEGPADPSVPAYGIPGTASPKAPGPSPSGPDVTVQPIDLPTALRLVNTSNPTIALARTRVEEAYAQLREAQVLWIPDLVAGPSYLKHDGLIQNALGTVFNTSKDSLFIGGGAVLSWDTSDVLFGRLIARQLVQAQAAESQTVTDDVQLEVALTYLDLLRVYGRLAINAETLQKAQEMLDTPKPPNGPAWKRIPADTNRARTEVEVRREERIDLEGEAATVSAQLAQLLVLQPTVDLQPVDPVIVPIALVSADAPIDELVAAGLMNRPELAQSRALVAAALARWRQARVGPLLPHLNVSYTAGEFAAGFNDSLNHSGGRGDASAQAIWELHNFGFGDRYRSQVRQAQYTEANYHVNEVETEVAAEVTAAAKLVRARLRP